MVKHKKYFFSLFFLIVIIFLLPQVTEALNLKNAFSVEEGMPLKQVETSGELKPVNSGSVQSLIMVILQILLSTLSLVFIGLMIYGGYLWMTAMGKEQQVSKAKDLITRAIIGLIIIVGAYAVSYYVVEMLVEPNMKDPSTTQ